MFDYVWMVGVAGRGGLAAILHADLDSFYASVEQRDDPRLRGRPVLVGAGVVVAASYEAKACGISTPTNVRAARRLCPEAVVVRPRFASYVEASRRVFEIFRDTTPLVEGLSVDEAFLDVGGLARLVGPAPQIAADLRRRVRVEVGLPISVGVARTKFLAKVASAVSKPDGLLVVPPDRERDFLHPLPIERLWGVGQVTAKKLHADGIHTVGQLSRRSSYELESSLGGASGQHLWALANLLDPRPVEVGRRRGSVGAQCAMGRRPRGHSRADLDAVLVALTDRVTRRLRAGERSGRTLTLRLRFDDFARITRSVTLAGPTTSTARWLAAGRGLLDAAWPLIQERGCTMLGIGISGLRDRSGEQLELPLFDSAEEAAVDEVLDDVRARFGKAAITRAVLLGREAGLEMPTLPDAGPDRGRSAGGGAGGPGGDGDHGGDDRGVGGFDGGPYGA